jgi:hypothetical protein
VDSSNQSEDERAHDEKEETPVEPAEKRITRSQSVKRKDPDENTTPEETAS